MRYFRLFLYSIFVIAVIEGWELCRGNVVSLISHNENKATAVLSDEKTVEHEKNVVEKEAVEKAVEKKVVNSTSLSFERGFADIAKQAMGSVVNVATMQIIKDDVPQDVMGGFFKGSPFEDMFKDFFGDQQPNKNAKGRRATSLGSGFIVGVDKAKSKVFVVTNNHVVDKAKKIVVYLYDKTELPAELHAFDQRTDIAVLSIDTKILGKDVDKLIPVKWADSDDLEEGNWVVAIGNPFGLGSTVTHGIVSGKGRSIGVPGKASMSFVDDFIQHSAPINMGNSGGCLLDVHGSVIGINNAIFSTSGGNIGIGFAIPSNIAKNTVDQLIEHKRTYRGWLGAEVQLVTSKQAESIGLNKEKTLDSSKIFGAFVTKVVPNGPAEKAKIKRGDVVLEFNGKKISDKNSLPKIVGYTKIDSTVKAKIWRQTEGKGWEEIILDVKVGDFEKAIESGSIDAKSSNDRGDGADRKEDEIAELGITVSKIPERMQKSFSPEFVNNLIVTSVDESKMSGFFETLFVPGDIIVSANNKKVYNVKQLREILSDVKKDSKLKDSPVPFVIIRDGSMVMIATTLDFEGTETTKKSKK